MEKRIQLERRARKAHQITDLNLDNCRSTSIVGLTDEYTALESLSLINVGLTTLKGFPKLPKLEKLELSDNRISNGLNYLHTSPKLLYLNLSGNKIKDLEALKPLEEFKHLAVLDLFNNEVTQIENYREKIFEMLPSLKFLDGFDCNDVEAPSEGDDDDENNYSVEEDNESEEEYDDVSTSMYGSSDDEVVLLSEVYNDDIEEDEDEWDEENAAGSDNSDDDDEDSDEDEANEPSAVENAKKEGDGNDASAEDSQARGKKRKHEG